VKGYPQPLSEAFVYSSPERPQAGSFRWVKREETGSQGAKARTPEVKHVPPRRH